MACRTSEIEFGVFMQGAHFSQNSKGGVPDYLILLYKYRVLKGGASRGYVAQHCAQGLPKDPEAPTPRHESPPPPPSRTL